MSFHKIQMKKFAIQAEETIEDQRDLHIQGAGDAL